jgi:hypothetical protein
MSIQTIINSAQTIEVSRPALVASSMSRSGRLFTGTRNFTKPWRFIISPKPIWRITDVRGVIEAVMTADKHTEQQVSLGQGGANWITAYQGSLSVSSGALVGVTCASATGTAIVINYTGLSDGLVILKPGDIIQPAGHRYPYVVTNFVTATGASGTATINLHRGFIPQTAYSVTGLNLLVGAACIWRVKVSSLPSYRYVSGQLVEFTDDFELIESII